ncbi:hypothetical protein [Paraburkholderia lycopersici]|uniref:SH3 domain-containing protein n=1 Tax=Paraburkholderia lycopersici TaxID=416944 RepID=A0A1G6NUE1_9BURK|nr:hypothetical protein [Paraburkholderia lycopersici]SDC70954.1 hypothetical protein SAMN05421548_109163 [Paraburkholderia lycopersici]
MKQSRKLNLMPTLVRRGANVALPLAVALAAAWATQATAAQSILSVKRDPLPLYATPAPGTPASSTHASGLPWPVLEDNSGYYRVRLDGKDYWVDSMNVRASQVVKAACEKTAGGTQSAGDLGSSTNRCQ